MEKPIIIEDSPETQQEPSPTKEPTKAIVVSSTDMPSLSSTTIEEEKTEEEKEAEEEKFDPLSHMVQDVIRELYFNGDGEE